MSDVYTLTKDDSVTLSGHVRVGAAWDVSSRGKGGLMGKLARKIGGDLDALAVLCDTDGNPVRMAGLDNNDPMKDGSVLHSGDNQTGKGEGDDETIDLHLNKISPSIGSLILMVAAFKDSNLKAAQAIGDGESGFGGVDNVTFNFYDMAGTPGTPAFDIMPSLFGSENVCLMARLDRVGTTAEWTLTKVNQMVKVKHGDRQALLRAALNTTAR